MVGHAAGASLHLHRAIRFRERLLGLLAMQTLGEHSGLWLYPCRAVHTFGMKRSIDVVFLDVTLSVLRVVPMLRPYRVAIVLGARSVVELPAGYCSRHPDFPRRIRHALGHGAE